MKNYERITTLGIPTLPLKATTTGNFIKNIFRKKKYSQGDIFDIAHFICTSTKYRTPHQNIWWISQETQNWFFGKKEVIKSNSFPVEHYGPLFLYQKNGQSLDITKFREEHESNLEMQFYQMISILYDGRLVGLNSIGRTCSNNIFFVRDCNNVLRLINCNHGPKTWSSGWHISAKRHIPNTIQGLSSIFICGS